MGGGLLQLVAYGAQDAFITGNPEITFWKGLYKRHSNFAMEPFRINLTGTTQWGQKQSATIPRHADLMFSTYIEIELAPTPANGLWAYITAATRLGYAMIKYVELEIGGQLIDRLYGEYLFLWDSLTQTNEQKGILAYMVGGGGENLVPNTSTCNTSSGRPARPVTLRIPLSFFYTRNPSAALPLIALQYHEVRLNIEWSKQDMFTYNGSNSNRPPTVTVPPPSRTSIYVDYIYLDVEERRRMATESHEYLIEQVQFNEAQGITSYNEKIDLTFNHPVKELIWVSQLAARTDCKLPRTGAQNYLQPFVYDDIFRTMTIQINGQDRVSERNADYFWSTQVYQHHTGSVERVNAPINVYSFAIRPEEHQPSGTCNFSRIDTSHLLFTVRGDVSISETLPYNIRVYAVNYNILRIMNGMAGLAFSN